MNKKGKKFISPGAWFSLIYPQNWNEFEDSEGTFLFYNPGNWNGNFRISAYKADAKLPGAMKYGADSIQEELKKNSCASAVKIGKWECAYSKETFQEGGTYYVTHIWITGIDNLAFECSFTVPKGGDQKPAEDIIATLEARREGTKYPLEAIPVRILEIGAINEAFEWTSSTVKKQLKKDFTGTKEDLSKLQQLLDTGEFNTKQRDTWYSFGIALGTILVNEIDGLEWVTILDGNREFPALRFEESSVMVYPQQLIWDLVKNNQPCDLMLEFEKVKNKVIEHLNG